MSSLGACRADQPRGRGTVAPPGLGNILGIGVVHMGPSPLERAEAGLFRRKGSAAAGTVNAASSRQRTASRRQPPGAAGDRRQRLGVLARQQADP